jgi:hypothetical protein
MVLAPPLGRGLLALVGTARGWRRDGHGGLASGPLLMRSGQPVCREPGHTFVTPHDRGLSMKPSGHGHEELTHVVDRTGRWVLPILRAAPVAVPDSCCVTSEAADLAVAQPVVDEGQQVAGGGDAADVAAPAGPDAGLH